MKPQAISALLRPFYIPRSAAGQVGLIPAGFGKICCHDPVFLIYTDCTSNFGTPIPSPFREKAG
ncbi:MAG: hypothetical protein ACU843_08515 [Gammaproteobacteria bacterium]